MVLPPKVWEDVFQASHEGTKNFLFQKIMGGGSKLEDYAQIMPRFQRSFINDKCIFQLSVGLI